MQEDYANILYKLLSQKDGVLKIHVNFIILALKDIKAHPYFVGYKWE